jgi:serine/threonine protein kinase
MAAWGQSLRARDRSLNRLRSHENTAAASWLLSGAARKRFAREVKRLPPSSMIHVMPIHCVDEWQGVPYLVMHLLTWCLVCKNVFNESVVHLKFARDPAHWNAGCSSGLAAAHAQGIVHRDIKPARTSLLDQSVERVQLTDFGLARAVDDASLTRSGTLAGTPQYMSPEQARAETVDHRSDLFSLGSVMYAMCTGHAPFRAESSYAVLRLITDKEPRPIREVNPDVPAWLCMIITKLMAKQV